jgi:uncharacterized membrane protein YphA (DoxX/SURF4 family)
MTDHVTEPRSSRAFTVFCWVVAASFVAGGGAKFMPGAVGEWPPYSERFVDWGYPSWFRFVVGSIELAAAPLLVMPRYRLVAAGLLLPVLNGAIVTHIINSDPISESIAAPVVLVLVAVIAWVSAPWDWTTAWSGARPAAQPTTETEAQVSNSTAVRR